MYTAQVIFPFLRFFWRHSQMTAFGREKVDTPRRTRGFDPGHRCARNCVGSSVPRYRSNLSNG